MSKLQHVIVMVLAVIAFLIPTAKSAEAALWHPSSTGYWSVDRICHNGVEITWRSLTDVHNGESFTPYEMDIAAYHSPMPGSRTPQKLEGVFYPGPKIGSVHLILAMHEHPLQWMDDEGGTGTTYVYDIENIYFPSDLPLGTSVIVARIGSIEYFLGSVTDCRV